MLKKLKNFIEDSDFSISIYKNKINIINYKKIVSLSSNDVSVILDDSKIKITGKNLSLMKLLDQEILIVGNINKIEVIPING